MVPSGRLIRAGPRATARSAAMTVRILLPLVRTLGLCAVLAGTAGAFAQASLPRIGVAPAPSPPAPVGAVGATPMAPIGPSASGLRSRFPAGLPTPIPAGSETTNTVVEGVVVDAIPATQVMGAAGAGYARSAPQYVPGGSGIYSAVDVARSFLTADANRDGELSRAEGTRLALMPIPFEEMDRDHNNVLTRSEYEDALR
jgi:hypothetical protein